MTVLRHLDPAIRMSIALMLTTIGLGALDPALANIFHSIMLWGPFAFASLIICCLVPQSVMTHTSFYAALFVVIGLIVGLATFGPDIVVMIFISIVTGLASCMFVLSYRWRRPTGIVAAARFAPPVRAIASAAVLVGLGLIIPPLLEVMAATADEMRRVDLVNALAATDQARQPRGDHLGFSGGPADVAREQAEGSSEVQAYLDCGGPILPNNKGVPGEARMAEQVAPLLDGFRGLDERQRFRSDIADLNSAFRIKAVQLCILFGLCGRPWSEYLRQPKLAGSASQADPRFLPGDHARNEQVARDSACGAGFRLSKLPRASLRGF